jgi:hypothetical protein
MYSSVNDFKITVPISSLNKKRKFNHQVDFTGLIHFLTTANFSESCPQEVELLANDKLFWSEWAPHEAGTAQVKDGALKKDNHSKGIERQKGFFCDWS